jgi:hypothetical protein
VIVAVLAVLVVVLLLFWLVIGPFCCHFHLRSSQAIL